MITVENLNLYLKYGGDIDSWARSASNRERAHMDDEAWHLIEGLLHDCFLVERGLASVSFADELESRLKECCDNQETISALKAISLA